MTRLLFIVLLIMPFFGFGQGWENTFGGINNDEGRSVQQTNDGGYIITGRSFGNGSYDVFLIKTDGNGDSLWMKTFGGINNEDGKSVKQTTDGGYIIIGRTYSFGNGNSDVYLIKTDGNGDSLWTKTFGGINSDDGKFIQQTNDGGYIISAGTNSFSNGSYDVYLIKTDGNGDSLWTKTFGGTYDAFGHSVQQTTDGGYIITGQSNSFGHEDIYLIKTDGNGDSLWTKTFGGGINDDWGKSVQQTTDGGYIITGGSYSFGSGGSDLFLIKTDGNGDSLWTKTFGGANGDGGHSVQQTNDGGYIICGYTYSFGNNGQVYLIKTDGNGDSLWTKTFGGINAEDGKSVQQTTDGGYIITGETNSFGNDIQVYLVKTDSQGNITSTFNITKPLSNRKLEKTVDILGREIKPQTNTYFIEIYDDGSTEIKMVVE